MQFPDGTWPLVRIHAYMMIPLPLWIYMPCICDDITSIYIGLKRWVFMSCLGLNFNMWPLNDWMHLDYISIPSNPNPSHPIQPLMAPRRYVHLWHVIFFFFWLRALINWILYFCALSNYCLSHFFPAAFSFDCWVRAPRPPQSLDFELCLICILICQNSPWVSAWLARNFYLLGSPFQHPVCSISGFKSIMNSVHMYADK